VAEQVAAEGAEQRRASVRADRHHRGGLGSADGTPVPRPLEEKASVMSVEVDLAFEF
jgi:hypothetical protein